MFIKGVLSYSQTTNPDNTKSAEKGVHFQRVAREF